MTRRSAAPGLATVSNSSGHSISERADRGRRGRMRCSCVPENRTSTSSGLLRCTSAVLPVAARYDTSVSPPPENRTVTRLPAAAYVCRSDGTAVVVVAGGGVTRSRARSGRHRRRSAAAPRHSGLGTHRSARRRGHGGGTRDGGPCSSRRASSTSHQFRSVGSMLARPPPPCPCAVTVRPVRTQPSPSRSTRRRPPSPAQRDAASGPVASAGASMPGPHPCRRRPPQARPVRPRARLRSSRSSGLMTVAPKTPRASCAACSGTSCAIRELHHGRDLGDENACR